MNQREGPIPDSFARIWDVVRRIPRGRVATYGHIALLAGLPRRARMVGTALRNLPPGFPVPWHRVLNASGRISFPRNSRQYTLQRELLAREGIAFVKDKVQLDKIEWKKARGAAAQRR